MMKNIVLFLSLLLFSSPLFAQSAQPIEVMTLGTFHFNFPNRDVVQVEKSNQIDVLDPQYQSEIDTIVARIAAFRPTVIAIERKTAKQSLVDSLYRAYINGNHRLNRSEVQQIGFRLAKKLKHTKLYAVDNPGKHYDDVLNTFKDSAKTSKFAQFYHNNQDLSKKYVGGTPVYKSDGIRAELIRTNRPNHITKMLGNYLIGHFKYESEENEYFGADFETGRWFNRNLRIFRNIQRIDAKKEDRILVIFGLGHLNLLNLFFDASPEYRLTSPLKYLKRHADGDPPSPTG